MAAKPPVPFVMRDRGFRLAAACYRRALAGLERGLPEGGAREVVDVFDALQREAWRSGGLVALVRCWAAEALAVRALRRSLRAPVDGVAGASVERSPMFTFMTHDVRDAWRSLRAAPGYAVLVVATLALGIGVNTAIFSVVDALLFKTLPYADPDRLVAVSELHPTGLRNAVAPANFLDWQEDAHSFAEVAARADEAVTLVIDGEPDEAAGAQVSGGYFHVLGVRTQIGRTFAAADDRAGAACTTVISARLWSVRFASRADVLGRAVKVNSEPCTVIGVLAASSGAGWESPDVYTPLRFAAPATRLSHFLAVTARLSPGVTLETARQEMRTLATTINAAHPETIRGWSATVDGLRDTLVASNSRQLVWVLFAAVGLVLLLACVNVTALALSRTMARRQEVSLRLALGASRWRVSRALLIESLLLAITGGFVGVLVGEWSLAAFMAVVPPGALPIDTIATLDWRALLFTGGIALVAGLLSGTLPAWRGATAGIASVTRAGARTISGSALAARLHGALLIAEVSLAMVLVVGATLLAVSFARLTRVHPGFDATDVLTMHVTLPQTRYKTDAEDTAFFDRLLERIRQLPRVESAGVVTSLPLNGWLYGDVFRVDGTPSDSARPTSAHIQSASPGYFDTLRIPLLAGRDFTPRDDARGAPVLIVNDTLARLYAGGDRAVGRHIHLGSSPTSWEIVGVIRDVKTASLGDADLQTPEVYATQAQQPINEMFVVVRARHDDASTLIPDVRAAVRATDPELPVVNTMSMEARVGSSLTSERFRAQMFVAFAALSGLLAALGVYAIRSQAVAARLREIGIRLALGATPRGAVRMILGQSLRLVTAGLVVGLAVSMILARYIQNWLFGTHATDPLVIMSPLAALGVAAVVASWIPARRATRVDPVTILRAP